MAEEQTTDFDALNDFNEDDVFGDTKPLEQVDSGNIINESAPAQTDDAFGTGFDNIENTANDDAFEGLEEKDPLAGAEINDSKLRAWKETREVVLDERREKAEADKAEFQLKGKENLEQFISDRNARIEKKLEMNRADEKQSNRDHEELMKNGTRWEKVGKLVDLRAKKDSDAGKDRMRSLMANLKAEKSEK